jgi:hypothetical protein
MSENPYADDGGYETYAEPERTSALAVTSLVMSLLCCIPGLGLLGAGLGVGALLGISSSRGRVGGKGVAIAGIIIGVMMSVAWIVVAVQAQSLAGMVSDALYGRANSIMTQIETGDYDTLRSEATGSLAQVTDAQLDAFASAYRAEYGSFQSVPTSWSELFPAYGAVAQSMQPYQGRQDIVPMPAIFDNGTVLMLAVPDPGVAPAPQSPGGTDLVIPMMDIWVVMPDGSELKLMSLSAGAVTETGSPASDDDTDDTGSADDDGP